MIVIDIAIIILLAIFALAGLRRGMVWELLTLIGIILGLSLTYYFRADLRTLTEQITAPGWQRQWGGGLIFLAFFGLIYAGFTYAGRLLHLKIKQSSFRWVDRIIGIAVGVLKGAVLIGLLVFVVDVMNPDNAFSRVLHRSKLVQLGEKVVYSLTHWESPSSRKWI